MGFEQEKFREDFYDKLEAAASRKRNRQKGAQDALDSQERRGERRLRISRPLLEHSQRGLGPLVDALVLPHERGAFRRRPLGSLALTVLDTGQLFKSSEDEKLSGIADLMREEIHEVLRSAAPRLYKTSKVSLEPIAAQFGGGRNVHWGLRVDELSVLQDQISVQDIVAPETRYDPKIPKHLPHISLGVMRGRKSEDVPLPEHVVAVGELLDHALATHGIGRTAVLGPTIIEFPDWKD